MSNYTKTTNFATKDNLSPGNPLKIVKGTEIDTEFNNIATAVATKTDNSAAAITGGAIDGAAIGGTTPAAGAFTTLAASGTTTLAGALVGAATQAAFNTVSTTLNLGGAATAVNLGAATGTATVNNTTLAAKAITASTTLAVTGASTLTGAVTASSTLAVTGAATLSSTLAVTGVATLGNGAVLGTPTSATLTNATGLPISTGVSGLGSNVATFLATPSSANLISAVTDETGTGALVFATSPTLVTPLLGTPTSATLTNATGLPISTGVSGLGTGVATLLATPSSANLASAITDETGSGSLVFATSPTLVTPILGIPTSGTLTNATGLPISTGVSGLGTGVATFLATPSSANLLSALTDETGTGSAVFATSPTLVTPLLGTPTSGVATNLTGLPLTTGVTGLLPVANGGTATATPSIVAGSNITVTGTWPNQTIAASGGGTPGGSTTQVQYNNAGAFGGITGATTNGTALTLVAPVLGTPASATLTNATGLPISTGVSGLGTGIATALAVNTGSAGAPVLFNGALGTPSSGTVTNLTGTASININGTVGATTATTGAFTSVTASTTLAVTGITTLSDDLIVNNAGAVATFNSTNSNGNKIIFQNNGVVNGYVGSSGTGAFLADNAATTRVLTTTSGAEVTGTLKCSATVSVGNATPSASGAGITFPATQSASTDANTLDDYEEGTFTPSLGGTATYNTQNGYYTKIGRLVTCQIEVDVALIGTGSTTTVSGFPFSAVVNSGGFTIYWNNVYAAYTTILPFMGSNDCHFETTNAAVTGVTDTNNIFKNGARIIFTVIYHIS